VSTCVYVAGFNLYYGPLRRTPHKWLDLAALCDGVRVEQVLYFSARISEQPRRSTSAATTAGHGARSPPTLDTIETFEEQGSDVNLAAHARRRHRCSSVDLLRRRQDRLDPSTAGASGTICM
jgi:hypothetical protein